jgi:hypothetical protein
VNNPEQRRVLTQLQVSGTLSKESLEAGSAPFVEMQNMIRDAIERLIFRVDVPIELISKMLVSWAEATMDLIGLNQAWQRSIAIVDLRSIGPGSRESNLLPPQ